MTHIFKILTILLILAVSAISCKEQANNENKDIKTQNNEEIENTNVCEKFYINETEFFSWCVEPYEVSENSENMLILENRTEEKGLSYGYRFSLEYFIGDNWVDIPIVIIWPEVYLEISPGKTNEENATLFSLVKKFNNAKEGKYRLVRRYSMHNLFFHIREQMYRWEYIDSITLYAEFIIE